MMSLIGISNLFFRRMPAAGKIGRKPRRGFTLLEVMITTAVLALGATMIYRSFFIAVDSFNYYATLLRITPWMDEKIWQAQNQFKHPGAAGAITGSGQLEVNNKNITWSLDYNSIDQSDNLYKIDLVLSWTQGLRQIKSFRTAYAIHFEK
ncbi:MAG: prepilin-type N-terminal cleavage/methylation domain-containing protein [Candidatus Omnitrophica bacterium]|nr:prepilin-type N-terminal cleavage/methylation domain-containing protein [Candidatus Omnitrophota bacterium]